MKYLIVIFLFMSTGLSGCKEDDSCYELGGTKENCESNPKCKFKTESVILFLDDSKFVLVNNILDLWKQRSHVNEGIGLCLEKNNFVIDYGFECHYSDEPPQDASSGLCNPYYCLKFGNVFGIAEKLKQAPTKDWFYCERGWGSGDTSILDSCGNGIIDINEQCDGTRLGSMANCATHGERLGIGEWTTGNIKCLNTCKWDYSDCQ